jgi:hypothetical protein
LALKQNRKIHHDDDRSARSGESDERSLSDTNQDIYRLELVPVMIRTYVDNGTEFIPPLPEQKKKEEERNSRQKDRG